MPLVDLDSLIEEHAGRPIPEIFEGLGEEGFREVERRVLLELCSGGGPASVIATGGGSPCQPGLLEAMLACGQVVHLATELKTALLRAARDSGPRPLLARSTEEVSQLYRSRMPVYRRANINVSTEEQRPEEVTSNIVHALSSQLGEDATAPVVALQERSYPVHTEAGCLEKLAGAMRTRLPNAEKVGLISDNNVMPLYGEKLQSSLEAVGFKVATFSIAAGEKSKSIEVFSNVADAMIEQSLDRKSVIVALGGGVVGDLAGYVAASLYRGIPVVQVPTTLLAMTDSAIGGKTGINSRHGKNLLGAFWQPELVWCDPTTLKTLPLRERRAAFGELVKYALLDAQIWDDVARLAPRVASENLEVDASLAQLVRRCANVKAAIVSTDERENGLRATLNLGHTVAHAIEAHAGFGTVLHGEAVALGLLATCRVSCAMGLCKASLESKVAEIFDAAGLDTNLDDWLRADVLDRIGVDKKRVGDSVRFIVVAAPGDVRSSHIELTKLKGLLLAN